MLTQYKRFVEEGEVDFLIDQERDLNKRTGVEA